MKVYIKSDGSKLSKQVECEMNRHNVTPREFYWECKQLCNRKGTDIEAYMEYPEWIHPTFTNDYHNMTNEASNEGRAEISVIKPLEDHLFVQNTYNFILEFDWDSDKRGTGYFYLCEWD